MDQQGSGEAPEDVTRVERALIVEDTPALSEELVAEAATFASSVRACSTVAEGMAQLDVWRPQLLITDVKLPDGTGVELLRRCAELTPAPCVVGISGEADRSEVFELAQLGMREFIEKPFRRQQLLDAVGRALSMPPNLGPHIKNQLGHAGLHAIEESVRETLVDEALARSGDNRRAAARLLSITRQALQHILRRRS